MASILTETLPQMRCQGPGSCGHPGRAMASSSSQAREAAHTQTLPPSGRQGFPRSATRPTAARCCWGHGTALLHYRPMAARPEHRPATERTNGGVERATPCSPMGQLQCAPAPGPPQPGEEAGRRPLAPPPSPLTRCLVALSSCSKPRGRVGGRRGGPCRVPGSRPSADRAHMATQAHSLSYAGCNFLRQRLVLSTLSGRPVKIRRIRARDDNPGLRGDLGGGVGVCVCGGGRDPGSPSRAAAGRVGGLVVGRCGRRICSGAAPRVERFPASPGRG